MSKIPANSTIGNLFVWPFCCVPADRDGCKVRCCITAISFWKHKKCYYINCLTPNRLNSHEGVFASCAQTERGHIGFLVQCTLHPVLLCYRYSEGSKNNRIYCILWCHRDPLQPLSSPHMVKEVQCHNQP